LQSREFFKELYYRGEWKPFLFLLLFVKWILREILDHVGADKDYNYW
jgi:hypothetical protein